MPKYGFEWSNTGWINIDTGWIPKECPSNARLEVTLIDTATYDRVYIYTLITSIKSLYRLNTTNNKEFYAGNPVDKVLDMPCNEPTVLLAIGYKGKQAYYTLYSFTALRENILTIKEYLKPVTIEELKKVLKAENGSYTDDNSIEKDLIFQEKFYKEKLRQDNLKKEQEFISKLYNVAFKCCNKEVSLGQRLFEENCTACHAACGFVLGPELAGITRVRSEPWLLKFIKNSQAVISSGDRMAVASYEKYNQQIMPAFEFLSDEEIKAILIYLEDVACE